MVRVIWVLLLVVACSCNPTPDPSEFIESIRERIIKSSPCESDTSGVLEFRPKNISIIKVGTLQEADDRYDFSHFWPVRTNIEGLCLRLAYDIK